MHHQFLVIGAGIAGLSLAHCIQQKGSDVAIFDKKGIAEGASGTPVALINPVTGRRAKLCWRPEQCYQHTLDLLKRTEAFNGLKLANPKGVLRPALFDKMAKKMYESFNNQSWPKGWVEWLDEKQVQQKKHPRIKCKSGAIWVKKGISLDMGRYVSALATMLKQQGVKQYTHPDYELKQTQQGWKLDTVTFSLTASTVLFATGSATPDIDWWYDIPIHPLKGQTAIFQTERPIQFDHSISSLGYFSPIRDHLIGVGSTYEHNFSNDQPTEDAIEKLKSKLLRTLPYLKGTLKVKSQWAGVRASTPDRMPIIGPHKTIDNLYLFAGFGSKGLLYSTYLANMLVQQICGDRNKVIAKEVHIKRYY